MSVAAPRVDVRFVDRERRTGRKRRAMWVAHVPGIVIVMQRTRIVLRGAQNNLDARSEEKIGDVI